MCHLKAAIYTPIDFSGLDRQAHVGLPLETVSAQLKEQFPGAFLNVVRPGGKPAAIKIITGKQLVVSLDGHDRVSSVVPYDEFK